jgi:hypothetical protein
MDSSVSSKDEIWFLRVCHHISTGLYEYGLCDLAQLMAEEIRLLQEPGFDSPEG